MISKSTTAKAEHKLEIKRLVEWLERSLWEHDDQNLLSSPLPSLLSLLFAPLSSLTFHLSHLSPLLTFISSLYIDFHMVGPTCALLYRRQR